jgi:hypothetical protein
MFFCAMPRKEAWYRSDQVSEREVDSADSSDASDISIVQDSPLDLNSSE